MLVELARSVHCEATKQSEKNERLKHAIANPSSLLTFTLEITQKCRLAINTYLSDPLPGGFVPAHAPAQQVGE
jgi:hypothetical protein